MVATIHIPAPLAVLGDLVKVLNYRKAGEHWELGIVVERTYFPDWNLGAGQWVYRVRLETRVDRHGRPMHLETGRIERR